MNIIQSLTQLITPQFNILRQELAATNYGVSLEGFSFQLINTDKQFTIKDLQDVIDFNPTPEGILKTCTFEYVEQVINKYLSYTSTNDVEKMNYEGFIEVSPELALQRKKQFWSIVSSYFKLPPRYCLKHDPETGSYFDDYLMWEFTFCLFNGNHGIVLHGCASD